MKRNHITAHTIETILAAMITSIEQTHLLAVADRCMRRQSGQHTASP